MRLSKKLIAGLLIAAMVITHISVLSFADDSAKDPAQTENPYATGVDDGAFYFWRVPNTQADGSELLKNSAGRTYFKAVDAGLESFNERVGRHYETLKYTSAAKTSAMFVEEFDGERFMEIVPNASTQTHTEFRLSSSVSYNGSKFYPEKGIPSSVDIDTLAGWAIRVKTTGEGESAFELRVEGSSCVINGYMTRLEEYTFIDAKTHVATTIPYGHIESGGRGYYFNGEMDGWLIVPFKAYDRAYEPERITNAIKENWENIDIHIHQTSCQANHAAGWSDWTDRKLYVGDGVFLTDVNKFILAHAPGTIIHYPRNEVTDPTIPAVMSNDAAGNVLGNGLASFEKARPNIVEVTKPNETSAALHITPGYGLSNVMLNNDALSFDPPTQEQLDQVSDSIGMAFYLEVPEDQKLRSVFNVRIRDDGSEYHDFGSMYSYITIQNGVATEKFGSLNFKPGFKGYVMLPFLFFDCDLISSVMKDGMISAPDTISEIGFTFDTENNPQMEDSHIIIDDIVLYQKQEEFIDVMVKKQGGTDSKLIKEVKSFQIDNNPDFPRVMANDCTGVELEDGVFAIDGVYLTLIDREASNDAYVDITIGQKLTSVKFENHAKPEELSEADAQAVIEAKGISFDLTVPEDALMTVGTDMEISEGESEIFFYDSEKFYYTVENGKIYKVYGYLEFEPGFNGTVIIPFESFGFDKDASQFYDGLLNFYDIIDYFGFYFNTGYYASIEDTTISIDNITFYQDDYEYIDYIWANQTGNTPLALQGVK